VVCSVSYGMVYSFSGIKQYGGGGCDGGEDGKVMVYDHAKWFIEDTNFQTTASS